MPSIKSRAARHISKIIPAASLGLVIWLSACQPSGDTAVTPADQTKAVRVARVQSDRRPEAYTLTGVTQATDRATLAFQISGQMVERPVDIGSHVKTGDLIARLDQPELQPAAASAKAEVQRLQSQLAQARQDVSRVRTLYQKDAATQQALDNAATRQATLAAQLASARAQSRRAANSADELKLRAPIAGDIEQVFFQPGEFVPAGQPVVSLSGAQALEVQIGLPERLIDSIHPGDSAQLSLPFFNDRPIQGTLTRVSPAAGAGQLFQAVISVSSDAHLRPGLSVEWHLKAANGPGLLVPSNAIASPGDSHRPRVYVVRDDRVHAVPVSLGELVGDRVRVTGDLTAGDAVVTVGLNNLSDGRSVRVLDADRDD